MRERNRNPRIRIWLSLLVVAGIAVGTGPAPMALAAPQHSVQVSIVSTPGDVVMQTPSTLVSVLVTNNGRSDNVNYLQFKLAGSYTWGAITPPAGWMANVSGGTLTLTTTTNKIPVGGSLTLNLTVGAIPQGCQDALNELWMSKIVANFDAGPPPVNLNSPSNFTWSRRSLLMSLAMNKNAVAADAPYNTFNLTMTVTNRSSCSYSGIISVNNPPIQTLTATGFSVTQTSGPTPASLTLASGQTGTIVWGYTVGYKNVATKCPQAVGGTLTFSAYVRSGNGLATSPSVTSNVVSVGCFIATITAPACAGPGSTISVVMTVYNMSTAYAVNNLRNATLSKDTVNSTASGTASCGAATYPSPNTVGTLSSATITSSCTLPASALVGQTYIFQGQVTGDLQSSPVQILTTPLGSSNTLTFASSAIGATVSPTTVNAGGYNVLLSWIVMNGGCGGNPLNNVQITIPAGGWIYSSNASFVNGIDDWTATTTGSPASLVTYGAGTTMPLGGSGEFDILFGQIPATEGANIFSVQTTDTNGAIQTIPTTVTVGPAAAGGATHSNPEQELFQ